MAQVFGKQIKHYPILGNTKKIYKSIDLSVAGDVYKKHLPQWKNYLTQLPIKQADTIYYGGYLENRFFYSNEHLFGKQENKRDIHLGVDLWTETNTAVFCPIDGIVHSFAYNDKSLDYGYTIILKHEIEGQVFFSLYGHLNDWHLDSLKVNSKIKMGSKFCEIGPENQNGGWPPHLHFQLISNLDKNVGDYPGVCNIKDLQYYKDNCPDGSSFIFKS